MDPADTGTGEENVAVCQPDADSELNVAEASVFPELVHSLAVWVPLLPAVFQNRTPVTCPSTLAVKGVPNSTLLRSPPGWAPGGLPLPQIVTAGPRDGADDLASALADMVAAVVVPTTITRSESTAAPERHRDRLDHWRDTPVSRLLVGVIVPFRISEARRFRATRPPLAMRLLSKRYRSRRPTCESPACRSDHWIGVNCTRLAQLFVQCSLRGVASQLWRQRVHAIE